MGPLVLDVTKDLVAAVDSLMVPEIGSVGSSH
jgi:hypothetical protein